MTVLHNHQCLPHCSWTKPSTMRIRIQVFHVIYNKTLVGIHYTSVKFDCYSVFAIIISYEHFRQESDLPFTPYKHFFDAFEIL